MGVKPPKQMFRVEAINVTKVKAEAKPKIEYVDREVEKVVEKVVHTPDAEMLERLNRLLKENGHLKKQLQESPVSREPVVEIKEVIREIPVVHEVEKVIERVVVKHAYKIAAISSAITAVLGFAIGKMH